MSSISKHNVQQIFWLFQPADGELNYNAKEFLVMNDNVGRPPAIYDNTGEPFELILLIARCFRTRTIQLGEFSGSNMLSKYEFRLD